MHDVVKKEFCDRLSDVTLTALDVGARGGFSRDLEPIAPLVHAVGFEPDAEECDRLNAAADGHGWRSLRYIPEALGSPAGPRTLHLYKRRGCSSLLEADSELAGLYQRDDYFVLEGRQELTVRPLDDVADEYGIGDAEMLKVDVQGLDLEVLQSASELVRKSLLAIRAEVSFVPVYKSQPLFSEIEQFLRGHQFVPMEFLEMHHWRRSTRTKLPKLASGDMPFSHGQLIHGDVLFFRDPQHIEVETDRGRERAIRAALLAIAYHHLDHAYSLLSAPPLREYILDRYGIDITSVLHRISQQLAAR